jgi:hypothetical protein
VFGIATAFCADEILIKYGCLNLNQMEAYGGSHLLETLVPTMDRALLDKIRLDIDYDRHFKVNNMYMN